MYRTWINRTSSCVSMTYWTSKWSACILVRSIWLMVILFCHYYPDFFKIRVFSLYSACFDLNWRTSCSPTMIKIFFWKNQSIKNQEIFQNIFFLKIKKCIFNHKHEQTLNVVWRRCSWYCFSQVESSKVTVYKFIINLISNFLQKYIEWWNGLFALIRAIEKETRTER